MRRAVSVFLWGFFLDALLSVAAIWLPIPTMQTAVAWMVFLYGCLLLAVSAITPRISKRLLYPPMAFLVWTNICGAFPLGFPEIHFPLEALSWIQLVMAIPLLVIDATAARWHPSLINRTEKPAFRWLNLLGMSVLLVLAFPFALVIGTVNTLGITAETSTGGYLKLRPSGLMLEEREFQRGDKRVRLVSMMHIGNQSFYDEILESLPKDGRAAVLMEGISDDKNLLTERFSYAEIARMLGLVSQESSALQRHEFLETQEIDMIRRSDHVDFLRADVDVSTFDPTTLAFINAIGKFLTHPTLGTAREAFADPASPLRHPNANEIVMNDILVKRNEHLLEKIHDGLAKYDLVVVPWGALHLPDIQAQLVSWGFEQTKQIARPVIRFPMSGSGNR